VRAAVEVASLQAAPLHPCDLPTISMPASRLAVRRPAGLLRVQGGPVRGAVVRHLRLDVAV